MPRRTTVSSDDEEPLQDTTASLPLHSKRTQRQRRKQTKQALKRDATMTLARLPTELILECLKHCSPRDVLNFGQANHRLNALVRANANVIGDCLISRRYTILIQCFPLPKLLADVDASAQPLVLGEWWQSKLSLHKNYQHVQPPDANHVCSCLTCLMAWNNLGVALDFAHWQDHLDSSEPIPMIPRGRSPEWNRELLHRHATIATAALQNSLWHARILEMYLDSTIRAIRRQAVNKGNKRKHVDMTDEDAALGTDVFLAKPGPPSVEFVFHRDNYYMLEAYMPNRYWKKWPDGDRWIYVFAGQHARDLEFIKRLAASPGAVNPRPLPEVPGKQS